MTRWFFTLLLCSCFVNAPTSLAWEMPYGVQDPMHSPGFPMCAGGEIGYWQFLVRESSDGKTTMARLVLTTVDMLDPAFVICYVPSDRKVLVMEHGKQS